MSRNNIHYQVDMSTQATVDNVGHFTFLVAIRSW